MKKMVALLLVAALAAGWTGRQAYDKGMIEREREAINQALVAVADSAAIAAAERAFSRESSNLGGWATSIVVEVASGRYSQVWLLPRPGYILESEAAKKYAKTDTVFFDANCNCSVCMSAKRRRGLIGCATAKPCTTDGGASYGKVYQWTR